MAKLLTREEFINLQKGDHVWVEWVLGTKADEWIVSTVYSDPKSADHKMMMLIETEEPVGEVFYFTETMHRYWDSEPTLEEREETPWNHPLRVK